MKIVSMRRNLLGLALLLCLFTSLSSARPAQAAAATWFVQKLVTSGSDGTTRLLWDNVDGRAEVITGDAGGNNLYVPASYGPYKGWTATSIAVDTNDGETKLLWTSDSGQMIVWSLDSFGTPLSQGPAYGPYKGGWAAATIGVDNSDDFVKVVWNDLAGQMTTWSMTSNGVLISQSDVFGPYAGWTATALTSSDDGFGNQRVLWSNVEGPADVWTFDSFSNLVATSDVLAPFPYKGIHAQDISIDTTGTFTTQILWNYPDGHSNFWAIDDTTNLHTGTSANFGPFPGWSVIALDADNYAGVNSVLWSNVDGRETAWKVDQGGVLLAQSFVYGPFGGP